MEQTLKGDLGSISIQNELICVSYLQILALQMGEAWTT